MNLRTIIWPVVAAGMTILTAKAQQGFVNPVHNMRDGCVERHRGYFYIMGEETKGTISRSKDMVSWSNPVKAVTTDGATWLNDPQWTQAYTYKQVQAGDLIYRNGVWHSYFNGIGHCYCDEPQGNYKEQTLTEPFDDYGIDVQVFQDEDGEIYWVKKRNPTDPHPMTRAASNIDGPEVWAFRMNSPFSRWDITEGRVQMTHQRGHPTSLNHINFEGPELARYHDKYYIFYAVNRMGPRSGMYQVGCAISDQPMNFNNSKKYPHPVLTRNTEQQLIDYKPIAPTAEHGGWDARYTMSQPSGSWTSADYDDSSWKQGQGGFGYQEFDLYSGTTMTNARVRARKTFWKATNIYIRRTFTLDEVPSHMGMKLWVNGTATFYINGHDFKVTSSNNTYSVRMIDPSWLKPGENIVAVAGVSSNTSNTSQQLIDFGFYDTGDEDMYPVMIGPAQPNFTAGPNGFERWMVYKSYIEGQQKQSIDRIHFYGQEPVVESTVKGTAGYHPAPAQPTIINYLDYALYYPFRFLGGSEWKVVDKVMVPTAAEGGELLLRKPAEANYRFEVPLRLEGSNDWGGAYAYYKDEQNWVRVEIGREGKWRLTNCLEGTVTTTEKPLPAKFRFLEDHPLVADYAEPWHTLTMYKNVDRLHVMLDEFNLTIDGDAEIGHSGAGTVGLVASSPTVSFDAIQYTTGWDEWNSHILGWIAQSGTWIVDDGGLSQQSTEAVEALALKGDPAWNYEFSAYMTTDGLATAGEAGFYPVYADGQNYVRATINYGKKALDITSCEQGIVTSQQTVPLKHKTMRQYSFSTSTAYPTNSYIYELRNETEVSGIDVLWLEGPYPYLNQTFDLPTKVIVMAREGSSWKQVEATLQGEPKLGVMNTYTFAPVKTSAVRLYLTPKSGTYARPFCIYVQEDLAAGYHMRARRERDGVRIMVDGQLMATVQGNWQPSVAALATKGLAAHFNNMLCYQTGGIRVENISIAETGCAVGASLQLKATILPADATNTALCWVSSNPNVISVDDNGIITRHAEGAVTINAYAADGGSAKGNVVVGDATKVESVMTVPTWHKRALTYNLAGQRTAKRKGLFIVDGKKTIIK